jgi:hypothetical protein
VALFKSWWLEGMTAWLRRQAAPAELVFLCELGPPDYAITGADGRELSDRWRDALALAAMARELFGAAQRIASSSSRAGQ